MIIPGGGIGVGWPALGAPPPPAFLPPILEGPQFPAANEARGQVTPPKKNCRSQLLRWPSKFKDHVSFQKPRTSGRVFATFIAFKTNKQKIDLTYTFVGSASVHPEPCFCGGWRSCQSRSPAVCGSEACNCEVSICRSRLQYLDFIIFFEKALDEVVKITMLIKSPWCIIQNHFTRFCLNQPAS